MSPSRNEQVAEQWRILYEEVPDVLALRSNIDRAYKILHDALEGGGQVLVCGNGGSAADAEHIAGELAKPCALARPLGDEERQRLSDFGDDGYLADRLAQGLPVWPLVSQAALLTAIANDQGGDLIFAQQVMAYARPGDVLWVLSTSGNSRNVVHAVRVARAKGVATVAFTGPRPSEISELADVTLTLPGRDTPHVQHHHQLVYHALCLALEAAFYA
jgi:D-sedoheptulose 7-phosphate isomerase